MQALDKEAHKGGVLFGLVVKGERTEGDAGIIPPKIKETLTKFDHLFEEPRTLPLARGVDHCILLREGFLAINVQS